MSDIFGKLKSGAGKVAFEADKVAHIKRIELDIGQLKRQVEDHHKKLGEVTYNTLVNKEPVSPEAEAICTNITDLLEKISLKEEEIKKINAETYNPDDTTHASSSSGRKFCTNCGKENDASVKFCSECGAKMA